MNTDGGAGGQTSISVRNLGVLPDSMAVISKTGGLLVNSPLVPWGTPMAVGIAARDVVPGTWSYYRCLQHLRQHCDEK